VWTPADNESIQNLEKSQELFKNEDKSRLLSFIIESQSDNLLTRAAFKEMIALEDSLNSIMELSDTERDRDTDEVERPGKGREIRFSDMCDFREYTNPLNPSGPLIQKCYSSAKPIDFIYSRVSNPSYDIDAFESEAALI